MRACEQCTHLPADGDSEVKEHKRRRPLVTCEQIANNRRRDRAIRRFTDADKCTSHQQTPYVLKS
jgi:hypothetical protein